jgi:hypothetical protein
VQPRTPRRSEDFVLQFPLEAVREYAARFDAAGDDAALALGRAARERGHYTREEFVAACRWKTPRSAPLVARNTRQAVEAATRVALGGEGSAGERMDALRALHGVEWATGSVLLHLAYPDRYPILDVRALHALGVTGRTSYTTAFWEAYVAECERLAAAARVDGRTLDRALWQWSREQGSGRLGARALG